MSRYADLKVTSEQLARQNADFRELLDRLTSGPSREAAGIYHKLRATGDPLATLQLLRNADAQRTVSSTDGGDMATTEVAKIDAEALASSVIRVPARPWTLVAGDGLVSHLISAFFSWDDPLVYSFLDRELFVRDMRQGLQPQGQFCSPFLVNALCAMRSVSHVSLPLKTTGPPDTNMLQTFSDMIKSVKKMTTIDLRARFVSEAKQHLDTEAGRLTLTTAQGLYVMFLVSHHNGANRAGSMYRLAALDTLFKLKPENIFAKPKNPEPGKVDPRQILSKACWGIFNLEWRVVI